MSTDDDNKMCQISSFEAQGFDSLYLKPTENFGFGVSLEKFLRILYYIGPEGYSYHLIASYYNCINRSDGIER